MKKITRIFLYFLICGCISITAKANHYYVVETGTNGTGANWSSAWVGTAGLKLAISSASIGDTIHVAAGTYQLTARTDYFNLKKGVTVLGGYPAGGGPVTSRDRDANPTTLSGQYFGTGQAGTNRVTHVIQGTGDISGAQYNGFIVENGGSTSDWTLSTHFGGGVLLENITNVGTDPVLNNIFIRNCMAYAGGGIGINNSTVNLVPVIHITHTTVESCKTNTGIVYCYGGGIFVQRANVYLNHIHVRNNSAYAGGGISIGGEIDSQRATAVLENITATQNTAVTQGGGIRISCSIVNTMNHITVTDNETTSGYGGGISVFRGEVKINTLTLTNNKAITDGGGMYISTIDNVYVENAWIANNIAGYKAALCSSTLGNGGGIYNSVSRGNVGGIFKNISMYNNQAHNSGGGMYNTTASLSLINFCINNNRASNGGGIVNTSADMSTAVLLVANNGQINHNIAHGAISNSYGYGGGMYNTTAQLNMNHVEIVGNHAENHGGGMFNTTCHWQKCYNLLIADNFSRRCGGGIHNTTCHNNLSPASTINDGSPPTYVNCTIAGNFAAGNYSLYDSHTTSGGGFHLVTTLLVLQNCIVYNNYGCPDNSSSPIASDIAIRELTTGSVGTYYDTKTYHSLVGTVEFLGLMISGRFTMFNSMYGTDPQFTGKADCPLLAGSNFAIGAGSNCQERYFNGSINRHSEYYYGNYRLQTSSPCMDTGNNGYLSALSGWSTDLDKTSRIQEGIVDMGAYEGNGGSYRFECFGCTKETCVEPCPPIAIWTPGLNEGNWNNHYNWRPQLIPGPCTTVYIPGNVMTFPFLTEPMSSDKKHVCDQIFFMQGGEVGRHDLLTYNKSHVQYHLGHHDYKPHPTVVSAILSTAADPDNEGKAKCIAIGNHLGFSADNSKSLLSRNQWHMLSVPVHEVVSGDFSFGGYPRAFMRRFIVQKEGVYPVGQFTEPFSAENVPLKAGEGFAYWMNGYDDHPLYREFGSGDDNDTDLNAIAMGVNQREYGIQVSNGIIQIPYFYDPTLVMSHRIASQLGPTTTFHYYWWDRLNLPVDISIQDTYHRTAFAYKMFDTSFSYPLTLDGQEDVLIGNPYMSTIDFVQFYKDNSDKIFPMYRLYDPNSKTYFVYTFDPLSLQETIIGSIDRYISPQQGFFVRLKNSITTTELVFNIATISVKRPPSSVSILRGLNNESNEKNTIRIKAINDLSSSEVILAKKDQMSCCLNERTDIPKLFSNNGGVPEVFIWANDRPLVIYFTEDESIAVPVGLRTKANGKTTLQISGMEAFDQNYQIVWIDSYTQVKSDLTGKKNFEYSFDNSSSGLLNDRFFIQVTSLPNRLIENKICDESTIQIYYSDHSEIVIQSSTDNPIREVEVYNTQGVLMQKVNPIDNTCVRLQDHFSKGSMLLIKVIAEKGIKTTKVICP